MTGIERPKDLREALLMARKATDPRSEFEVYQDIARILVRRDLEDWLRNAPITTDQKTQVIESQTFAMAQPAHLRDAASNQPVNLLGMLEKLGVISPEPPAGP